MRKNHIQGTHRYSIVLFACSLWVALLLAAPVMHVFAAGTLSVQNLGTATSGDVAWTLSETGATVNTQTTSSTSCGQTTYTEQTATLVLKNNYSSDAVLTFKYSADSGSTLTIDGSSVSSGTYSETITAGQEVTIVATSSTTAEGTWKASLSDISLMEKVSTGITFVPVEGVSYSVNGTEVSASSVTLSGEVGTKYTITVGTSGYYCVFLNWSDGTNNGMYVLDASNQIQPTQTCEITPIFVYSEDGAAPFTVDSTPYWTWDAAFMAAGTGTVVLTDNYDLPIDLAGNFLSQNGKYVIYDSTSKKITYNIPDGATLLAPYNSTDITIDTSTTTDDSGNLGSTWIHANVAFTSDQYDDGNASNSSVTGVLEPGTSVYLNLTIPSGTTVNVNSGSKLVIGGTIVSGTTMTGGVCGGTAGAHSNVTVDGTLNINSGGILSSCGYVLGTGNVNIVGGSAYQPFVMVDYHDGHYTANSTKNANFPIYRYSLQNIRPTITMSQNGKMFGYVDIYTQETNVYVTTIKARHNVACVGLIGDSDDEALIQLASSSTTVSATYDSTDYVTTTSNKAGAAYYAKAGKTKLTINGGASLGNLSISVYVPIIGAQTSSSSTVNFPIPYHYDIILENGDYTLPYTLVLYPGATMHVKSGANLIVSANKLVALDGLHDHSSRSSSITAGSWYEYHYPSTANFQNNHSKGTYTGTSNLIVDGTLTVNSGASFGGYVQTNGTGKVVMNGTPSATVGVGNVTTYGTPVNEYVGRTEHTLSGWLYRADGGLITMAAGKTYSGTDSSTHTIASYDYIVYTSPNQSSSAATPVNDDPLNANIIGSWICGDEHTYGDGVITTPPTCTATGIQTLTCTVCGFAKTEPVKELGHTEVTDDAVAPDCNTTGLTEGKHCSVCGTVITAQDTIAALGHDWGDGTVITEATCGNSGLMQYTCTRDNCGHTKEEVIPATGNHTEEIIPGTDSTCTSTGLTEGKKCSICGQVTVAQEEVPMLDHTEETLAATDPTCTETGLTEGKKCRVCGTTIVPQEIIPALGHTEETIDGKKQTCTEDGLTEGKKCTVCGEITLAQERIPAAGHKWEKGVCTVCGASSEKLCDHTEQDSVVTEPTCTAQGYTTHTCTACGYSYIDTYVDAMGHTPGAAATCTEDQTCTVCGTELAAAIGHNYSSAVTAPTCTESGYTTHTCQNCGHSYTDTTVEAKGHTPGEPTTVRTEPSCTEEGSVVTLTSCSICGAEVSRETTTLTALGHTEVIDPAVSSTCSAPGKTEGKHCSVCQEILIAQEEVPTLAHSYQSVVTEPTCTEGGYTTHTCSNCGDSYVDTETEAVGHKYTSNVVAPTCSAVGYTEHICTQCGDSYRDSEVAASGHQYTASVTPPTCSAAGYTTYTCAVCGSSYTGNETAALGHEYVNGVCTRCGDEEKPVGVITPYQATLSLKSLVYMNIYSVIDGFDGIDLEKNMGLLVWTGEEADYSEELMVIGSDHVTAYNGAIQKGSYYYVQSGGITAKELGDEFHLRVYVKVAEDSYIYSKAITYGPQVYALNKLNAATSEDNSESLKKLVVSMLDYGAAAQLYFGYNTEDLANNIDQTYLDTYRTEYSASMLQAVTAADSSVVGDWSRDRVNCPNVIGSLILKGIITNNFSFKFTEEIMGNIDTAHCLFWDAATYAQLKADGASFSESNAMLNLELVKDPADGYLKAGYDKTAVKNLGDTLYVCAVVTTTDGSTYQSGIISYSGHAYIKNKVGATDEKLVDLVKCLTVYSDTAKIHFASQE